MEVESGQQQPKGSDEGGYGGGGGSRLGDRKELSTRLFVEALGAFFLTMAASLGSGSVFIGSLATGLALFIYMFGPVSGAHFNPAVTLAVWISGKGPEDLNIFRVLCYWAAQILGALIGGALLYGINDDQCYNTGSNAVTFPYVDERITKGNVYLDEDGWTMLSNGTPAPSEQVEFGTNVGEGFAAEMVAVFLLCLAYCLWGNVIASRDTTYYGLGIAITYFIALSMFDGGNPLVSPVLNFAIYLGELIPRVACRMWSATMNPDSSVVGYFDTFFETGEKITAAPVPAPTIAGGIIGGGLTPAPTDMPLWDPSLQFWLFFLGDAVGAALAGLVFKFVLDPVEGGGAQGDKRD